MRQLLRNLWIRFSLGESRSSDTIRCPAVQALRPSGVHTRNRAIRERTPARSSCAFKARWTPAAQHTIHRLVGQSALDRTGTRIHSNSNLMMIRRCTVEHPFGRIKRISGSGRSLTGGLTGVKAEAALSIPAFNILPAANVFAATAIIPNRGRPRFAAPLPFYGRPPTAGVLAQPAPRQGLVREVAGGRGPKMKYNVY